MVRYRRMQTCRYIRTTFHSLPHLPPRQCMLQQHCPVQILTCYAMPPIQQQFLQILTVYRRAQRHCRAPLRTTRGWHHGFLLHPQITHHRPNLSCLNHSPLSLTRQAHRRFRALRLTTHGCHPGSLQRSQTLIITPTLFFLTPNPLLQMYPSLLPTLIAGTIPSPWPAVIPSLPSREAPMWFKWPQRNSSLWVNRIHYQENCPNRSEREIRNAVGAVHPWHF